MSDTDTASKLDSLMREQAVENKLRESNSYRKAALEEVARDLGYDCDAVDNLDALLAAEQAVKASQEEAKRLSDSIRPLQDRRLIQLIGRNLTSIRKLCSKFNLSSSIAISAEELHGLSSEELLVLQDPVVKELARLRSVARGVDN